ncbi:ABC transporter permease subunit [Pasteurellaceae bacterium LIM206]|nr:ABC transporter permease subunit [Pasteurellaceae bacterium LIM206]
MGRLFFARLRQDYFAQCCLLILLIVLLSGVFAPWLAPFDPNAVDIRAKNQIFSTAHWLGTDHLGRDMLSRLIWGIRTTVFYSVLAMAATLFIGVLIGMTAAIFGGKVDELLMRLCDMMLSFPGELMILALVGMLGVGIEHILLAVIVVKWAWYARMVRGMTMQYTHKNYVRYAKTVGLSNRYILRRHILPVVTAEIVILGSADIGSVILLISGLSFLGLGVQAPVAEWGAMLSDAKNVMLLYPQQMLPAGVAIVLVVAAFNGVGDFLRDVLDPDNRLSDANGEQP